MVGSPHVSLCLQEGNLLQFAMEHRHSDNEHSIIHGPWHSFHRKLEDYQRGWGILSAKVGEFSHRRWGEQQKVGP